MKKTKLLLSVLLVAFILVGCGKKDKKKDDPNNNNNNNKVEVGDTLDIELDASPSSGYEWSYEVTGDDAIVLANRYEEDKNCNGADGCSGKEIYTVSSTSAGNVNIKFVYARPNSGDPYNLVAEYAINIDDKLKISETHAGTYFEK